MAKRLDRLEKFLASNPQSSDAEKTSPSTSEAFIHPNQLPSLDKKEKKSKSNA